MGTRSLTIFSETWKDNEGKKKKQRLVTMYRQFDGYPTGHGAELAEFLSGGKLVNGIGATEKQKVFNGMGCLSAQVISHFKGDSAGGFYIVTGVKGHGEEYVYEVEGDFYTKELTLRCFEVGYIKGDKYINKKRLLFEGKPNEYGKWLKKYEKQTA